MLIECVRCRCADIAGVKGVWLRGGSGGEMDMFRENVMRPFGGAG